MLEIKDDSNCILIAPQHGARILRWQRDGREIITWPDAADWSQILKVRGGNPILFPFVARHFLEGKSELWRDESGLVRPMPRHGFARDAKFTVIDDGEANSFRMRLTDSAQTKAEYPFAFQFDVVVTLQPGSRLEVRFETTNRGDQPLPYYAGHHFYLAIPHGERGDWKLDLPCASWGTQAADGAILHQKPESDDLRLDDPRLIDRFQIKPRTNQVLLVNSRTQQRLVFDLSEPGSAPWYAVTTWTESASSDFYCIEPWLGLPNAIHHREGLRQIAAGETEVARCILDASAW